MDEGLVEARRGLGMFVNPGARDMLLESERRKFLDEEWPRIQERIRRLGLTPGELPHSSTGGSAPEPSPQAKHSTPKER